MNARTLARHKGVVTLVSGVALLGATALVAQAVPSGPPRALTVGAKGATLLENGKAKPVYGKKANTPRPQASTVKIMVASVVLASPGVDLERRVPVRKLYRQYTLKHHASTADLQVGDKVTVRQLLYASLLPSGADAAYALADTFGSGGTAAERVRSFVGKMNAKAEELRLDRTTYETFDGSGKDASSPNDLARLARHALRNDTFRKVVRTKKYEGDAPAANGRTRTYTWKNTNLLLGAYDGVVGVKTGTTERAGECLVFAAVRDGKTLVGTLMNSEDRFMDAAKMLDKGFGDDRAKDLKIKEPASDAPRD